jgi:RNA polymerase sigma-70 factor (ECF subfamily)
VNEADYERAVATHYEALYAFGYSLAGNEDDACELAQETFCRLLTKGGQLRDSSRVKSWLFTTLYRVFLGWKQRRARLRHLDLSSVESELPVITPQQVDVLRDDAIREAMLEVGKPIQVRTEFLLHRIVKSRESQRKGEHRGQRGNVRRQVFLK